jgi:outer membrane protein assembly factor BamA
MQFLKQKIFCCIFFLTAFFYVKAQDTLPIHLREPVMDSLSQQKDIMDVIKQIFPPKKIDTTKKKSNVSILPAIGYNPSIGFLLGINFLKAFYMGDPATTKLSVGQLDFSYTTKNLVIARFRTNIFTKNNKWNLQGNWQYTRNYVKDYGLGADARRDPPVSYPIRFNYFRLTEKAYKNLGHNLYAGMGVSFDMRNDISDEEHDSVTSTPHYQYSIDKGFDPNHYLVNGFILNVQYNTKEHPNRPFAGMYADFNIRYNTKILGSTKESGQLYTELRKYISLSQKNPEHVIALWYWGSYILWGEIPYLELPATEYDTYNRSGRGYTLGRFRGPSFADFEVEYRFPISQQTKLFSGVVFANFQTASDANNAGIFKYMEPAAGAGLRILFNKRSRTNICLDYARGRYGSSGIFFALNEAF